MFLRYHDGGHLETCVTSPYRRGFSSVSLVARLSLIGSSFDFVEISLHERTFELRLWWISSEGILFMRMLRRDERWFIIAVKKKEEDEYIHASARRNKKAVFKSL